MTTHEFTPSTLAAAAREGMTPEQYREQVKTWNLTPWGARLTWPAEHVASPEPAPVQHPQGDGTGKGTPTGWTAPVAMTDEDVATWLLGLGRKVEVDEVTGPMVLAAERWLAAYQGDFEFLLDVRRKATRGLSNGQAKGVLNCWRAELNRRPSPQVATSAPAAPATPQATPQVPEGHYAVTSRTGNNDLDFYRVDHGKGKWAGRTFVKRIIGGHPDQNLSRNESPLALAQIEAAGPEAAAQLYGQEVGRCCRCNRHLTDETSRQLGIGPECRKMA